MGNTEAIAAKHYLQITDQHFELATDAAQKAAHTLHEGQCRAVNSPDLEDQSQTRKPLRRNKNAVRALQCTNGKVEDRGLEPLTFWLPARRSPN